MNRYFMFVFAVAVLFLVTNEASAQQPNELQQDGKTTSEWLGILKASPSAKQRLLAAKALRKLKPKSKHAIHVLIDACEDKDHQVGVAAGWALLAARPKDKSFVPRLGYLLGSDKEPARNFSQEVLRQIGPPAVPELIRMGKTYPEAKVRARCLDVATYIVPTSKDLIPALIDRLMNDKSESVQVSAAYDLAHLGSKSKAAVPALLEALQKHKAWRVRSGAAYALGKNGQKFDPVDSALIKALKDKEPNVVVAAANALWRLKHPPKVFISSLQKAFQTGSLQSRMNAIRAIAEMGPDAEAMVPQVVTILDEGSGLNRIIAARALLAVGPNSGTSVAKMLNHKKAHVRWLSLLVLGRIGPEAVKAIPAIRKLAKQDAEKENRELAVKVLDRIQNRKSQVELPSFFNNL